MNDIIIPELPLSKQAWLEKIDHFILENLDNTDLIIAEIARAVFMSERQFFRKMKHYTGMTPNQYIQKIKLNKAKEILEAGEVTTVNELAHSVGYNRADYFSKLYESHFGNRPAHYLYRNLVNSSL